MKIDRKRLKNLVEEELLRLRNEYNALHSPETGRFQAKGKGKAVYSLTKDAEDVVGDTAEVPQRGITTNDGKTVSAKFGSNTGSPDKQCGRKTISGEKKRKTRRCRDYPKNYWAEGLTELVEELCSLDERQGDVCDRCIQSFLAKLRRANAALKAAQDGKKITEDDAQEEGQKTHYQGSEIDPKTRKTGKRAQGERRKKMRRAIGMYVEPFSRSEKQLLTPNLFQESLKEWATGTPHPQTPGKKPNH
jgi:hypothetical protein